jgi:hypothetical protein
MVVKWILAFVAVVGDIDAMAPAVFPSLEGLFLSVLSVFFVVVFLWVGDDSVVARLGCCFGSHVGFVGLVEVLHQVFKGLICDGLVTPEFEVISEESGPL